MIGNRLIKQAKAGGSRHALSRWALVATTAIVVAAISHTNAANATTFSSSTTPYVTSDASNTATAVFSLLTGTTTPEFQVVITNTTGASTKYSNPDLLSGFFFQVAGSPTLTPISATTTSEYTGTKANGKVSYALTCSSNCNENVAWGFKYSSTGFSESTVSFSTTAQYGVATSGFGSLTPAFGSGAQGFGGTTYSPGGAGGNLNYAIVSSAMLSTPTFADILSAPSVSYVFALPATYDVSTFKISNVSFAYGTNPDGTSAATSAPEPFSLGIFSTGLIAMSLVRLRTKSGQRSNYAKQMAVAA